MADMSKPAEALSWLNETLAYYKRANSRLRHVRRCAEEQRANFEACFRDGRSPSWCNREEYRKSVELLEAEIPDLEREAAEEAKRDAEEDRIDKERHDAELARVRKKYNIPDCSICRSNHGREVKHESE